MGKVLVGLNWTRYASTYVVLLAMGVPVATAASKPLVTAIDNASRVKLANSTHRATVSARDLGHVDPNLRVERMLLVLGPPDHVQPSLRAFIEGLHDKRSPNYHRWLTPEQFGNSFGPAQADLTKITAWLQQQGFDGIKVARGGSHIEFSGPAQSVERAFQTEIHSYQNAAGTHIANSTDISIPRALTGLVRGVNLQNFSLSRPMLTQPVAVKRDLSTGRWIPATPQSNFFSPTLIDPSDFAKIYDLDRVYSAGLTGTGETIAVVSRTTAVELSDVQAFREAFHLPPNNPNVIMNGPPSAFGFFGPFTPDAQESTLDVEWAGAIAPNATIDLVISGTTAATDGVDLSSAYIVDNNLADIMTLSFGECEASLGPARNSFFNAIFAQAAAQGISVLVGSGDSGAAECDPAGANVATGGAAVSGIASSPFDTAVGGTEFDDAGNIPLFWTQDGLIQMPNGYIPESVWNESATSGALFGTGGGVSTIYPKPSWQDTAILGVPNDNARDLPDVSLTAAGHDAYIICLSPLGTCTTTTFGDQSVLNQASAVGGTSVSVQVFGAIMALIDQKMGGRQGLANYGLYRLAANENYANCNSSNQTDPSVPPAPECVFNDITVGNNGVPGNDTLGNNPPPGDVAGQLGYNATPGYDPVTGLGSVNAFNLVNAWSALGFSPSTTTLSATTSTSVQHGQSVTFSISVAAGSGSAVPTGSVGLIAKTNNPFSTGVGVGGGTLVNGVFTGSFNTLPGGQYNVVAHYAGDGNFGPSDSNPIPVTVTSEASTVAIIGYAQSVFQSSPSPLTFGYGVPFVVGFQVTSASGAGTPTGTVTVFDNGQQIAQAPVSNTGYTILTNCSSVGFCLGFGQHTLTASYSGDAGLGASTTSQPFVYNIVKAQPQAFSVLSSSVPGNVFFTFSFLQSSLPIFPTGTVTVTDHINRDVITVKTYDLTRNPINDIFLLPFSNNIQFIFISYSGDANYLPVTTTGIQFLFPPSGIPTQVTITPLTSPIVVGQPVTLKATVTSSQSRQTPTGFADWFSGTTLLNPNLANSFTEGTSTIQTIMPNSGPIMVQYAGDSIFAPSAGIFEIDQASAQIAPVVAVKSNLATSTPSQQVTLTAALTPPPETVNPTGIIQFFDSLNGAAPVALGAPQPVLALQGPYLGAFDVPLTTNLPLGTHVVTAAYAGDGNYKPVSAANSIPVTVSVVDSLPANPVSPNFGAIDVGAASSTQSVNVLFSGSGTVSTVNVVTQGAIHSNFELVDTGTCIAQTPFTAGQSCMVNVTFAPNFAGTSMGAVVLRDAKGNVLGKQNLVGQGSASQVAFDSGAIFGVEFSGKVSLSDPESLAADGLGNVFIADNGNQRVLKVLPPGCSLTSSCQTEVASSANGLGGADGVAVDGAGNLYVSDPFKNQVVMVPPGCNAVSCTQIIASQSGGEISTPRQLAADGAGDLFIADQNNNRVVEVPAGCATSACQVALGSGLGSVFGVAVDGAGDVFISDSGNGQVVKLPAGCTGGSCQSAVVAGLNAPQSISVDGAGNLYIAESTQILEVSAATGNQVNLIANVALAPNANLTGVAVGPGGSVFIADAGASKVARLDRGDPPSLNFTTTTTPFGSRTAAQVVTVENIGTQPLSLQGVVVTQSAALDPATTTCTSGSQVAVGDSCTLGIEFAPTQLTGLVDNFLQGNILLVDNTLNQLNYNFNGNGVVARAAVQTIFVNGLAGNSQIISFPPLPSPVGVSATPIPLQATSNSGLPITYFVSGPASLEGSTLVVTAPGSVTVTATQPGDAQFVAATPVSQTITVTSQSASFSMSSSPSSLTVAAGQSATATITVTPSGGFNSPISLTCSQQSLVVCSFQPATLGPGSAPMSTTLKVTASSALADLRAPDVGSQGRFPLGLAVLFACFGIVIVPVGRPRRKRRARIAGMLGLLLASLIVISTTSCGNSNNSGGTKPPQTQNAIVTVTASGGNVNQSLTLNVTVSQ